MFYQADVYHSGSYYKFFRQSLETSCFCLEFLKYCYETKLGQLIPKRLEKKT